MIGKLKGIIDTLYTDSCILDVNGVGYHVYVPQNLLKNMIMGDFMTLYIDTWVREDAITLYGFESEIQKSCFKLAVTVQGVGGRSALSLLSVLSPSEFLSAITQQNQNEITKADGIGPKVATRILTELKNKAQQMALTYEFETEITKHTAPAALQNFLEDAVEILVRLGYAKFEVTQVIQKIDFNLHSNITTEKAVPLILKELALKKAL
jgi:holliday junction DNA helicase RuvA